MSNLVQTSENLNQFNTVIDKSVLSVDRLGSSLKSLSHILPIKEVIAIENEYSRLNRTLALTTADIEKLKGKVDELSKASAYYSKQTLTEMTAGFIRSTSALALFTQAHDQLVAKFASVYRQDAPQYLKAFTQISEQMPVLASRMKNASTSVTTLIEVFQRGGREGLSGYLTAINKVSSETSRTTETLSDSFKKLEASFDNLKTKIGGSGSGFLKGIIDFAAQNPGTAGIGITSVTSAAGYFAGKSILDYGLSRLGGGGSGGIGPQQGPNVPLKALLSNPRWAANYLMRGGLRMPTLGGLLGGGALMSAGELIQGAFPTNEDGQNAPHAFGQLTSIAGAGLAGSQGGPLLALGAMTLEAGRQIYGAVKNRGGDRKKAIEDAVESVRRRGRELDYGDYESQNILSTASSVKEGSVDETLINMKAAIAKSKGRLRGAANATLSEEERNKYTEEGIVALNAARQSFDLSNLQSQLPLNLAVSQMQQGAKFGTLSDSDIENVTSKIQKRREVLNIQLSTLDQNDPRALQEKNKIQQEFLQLKELELTKNVALIDQARRYSDIALKEKEIFSSNITSSVEELRIQKQLAEEKAKQLESTGKAADKLGAAEKRLEARMLERQAAIKEQIVPLTQLSLEKARIGYTTMSTPQMQLSTFDKRIEEINEKLKTASSTERAELIKEYYDIIDPSKVTESNKALTKGSLREFTQFQRRQFQTETEISRVQGMAGAYGETGVDTQRNVLLLQRTQIEEKLRYEQSKNNDDAVKRYEIERDILDVKLKQIDTYQRERQTLEFNRNMVGSQTQLLEAMKAPAMLLGNMRGKAMQAEQAILVNLKQEYDMKKASGQTDEKELMRLQEAIANQKVKIAQQFDIARRTFAEQFTEQTLGTSNGSYLFSNKMDNYSLLGSGYYAGMSQSIAQQGGRNRSMATGKTYQAQVSAMFGPGIDERSQWEQLATSLIGDLTSTLKETVLKVEVQNLNGVR